MGNEQNRPANEELHSKAMNSLGAWDTWFPYLTPPEQISLQGLNRYAYQRGVPRVQRPMPIEEMVYMPHENQIVALRRWSDQFTVIDAEFDYTKFISIQIGKNVFQMSTRNGKLRMLENMGSSKFRIVEKAPMIEQRRCASYCSFKNQFIFAIGGMRLSSVERYCIARDVWEEMPQLNVGRFCHSICTLGSKVFVVCGSSNGEDQNSIEKLETRDMQSGWQLIQISSSSLLTPRGYPVVVALNSSKILIMGGQQEESFLDDILTLDTKTNSVSKAPQNAPFELSSNYGAQQIRPGVVFDVVLSNTFNSRLIKYEDGAIRVLHDF